MLVGRPTAEITCADQALSDAHKALKRTQQQLLHSEKTASLGRLVAGLAHELNNPKSGSYLVAGRPVGGLNGPSVGAILSLT